MKNMKEFKSHMMYCKDGTSHKVDTYKKHMALKEKGCGAHKSSKK